jgi:hypothetical protein
VLRRIFGPKRDEMTGIWKKNLHDEELQNLYSSLNITGMIKSRRIRWVGHVLTRRQSVSQSMIPTSIRQSVSHFYLPSVNPSVIRTFVRQSVSHLVRWSSSPGFRPAYSTTTNEGIGQSVSQSAVNVSVCVSISKAASQFSANQSAICRIYVLFRQNSWEVAKQLYL